MDVSVTYGFISVLSSLMSKYKPSSIIVCWDGGLPDFRREALPQYKANRVHDWEEGERDEFYRQINELCDFILPIMGVISIQQQGAEADDLLYHASRILDEEDIIIVTSDKDLYQACNGNVRVLHGDTLMTKKDVEDYIGLPFNNLTDWRALQGDKTDNIPGVAGIGQVTATKLLAIFGDVVGVYNAAMRINPKKDLMSDSMAARICSFGMAALITNIVVAKLYLDKVGARIAIISNIYPYNGANIVMLKRFFMSRAFTSFLASDLFTNVRKLKPPKINHKAVFPVNIGRRFPVE
jgi:DNA polymerase-1